MNIEVSIPTALRPYVHGQSTVTVPATTVEEALGALTESNGDLARHLRDDSGALRSFVNVYLNDEDIRFLPGGWSTVLKEGDSLIIVPSIAGGRASRGQRWAPWSTP